MKIDIKKLKNDIKKAEIIGKHCFERRYNNYIVWKNEAWKTFCEGRGFGRTTKRFAREDGSYKLTINEQGKAFYVDVFHPEDYEIVVTRLYTLRAWLRGKNHRLNPPQNIRDSNRHYRKSDDDGWDMVEHNKDIAEQLIEKYVIIGDEIQNQEAHKAQ